MNINQPYDTWHFSGDEETYTTLNNDVAVDAGWAGNKQLTTLPANEHGFKASSGSLQNLIYIQGTTNYNGLRRIHAVATNAITIVAKYVEEEFVGDETLKTMFGADYPYEFLGYAVKLNAAGGAGSLTVTLDADAGSAFDELLDTTDMTSETDINEMWTVPKKCAPGDKIDIAYANTNDKTYGIKIFTRRLV